MSKAELGTKRLCGSCGGRFYDLSKDPIVCPMCATVFVLPSPAARKAPMPATRVRPQPFVMGPPEPVEEAAAASEAGFVQAKTAADGAEGEVDVEEGLNDVLLIDEGDEDSIEKVEKHGDET